MDETNCPACRSRAIRLTWVVMPSRNRRYPIAFWICLSCPREKVRSMFDGTELMVATSWIVRLFK